MNILVTGAHGLLGRSLLHQTGDVDLSGCGRSSDPVGGRPYYQVDLTDPDAVDNLLTTLRPDWVIHTAALTNVDQCQTEPDLARRINLDTVAHLATACRRLNLGLLHLSTDYVFDGREGPYGETDVPRPLSHYGALKLESEQLVLQQGLRGTVVRTLWLYGCIAHTRPNLVTWPLGALLKGETVQIVDDQWGNPTYVDDLSQILIHLCRHEVHGLLHMGGDSYVTRYEMTLQLARFFGLQEHLVKAQPTAATKQRAGRPLRSGLRTDALQRHLGRAPLNFARGLEEMARTEDFRRAFARLA
ncbi:MAG: sugar nucleotide-binding protein [Candidatus Latescibacteria bacterium]|nr:sugar nucleotide-binding protein [Candidatus Latescibacterota bacterium]